MAVEIGDGVKRLVLVGGSVESAKEGKRDKRGAAGGQASHNL